MTSKRGRYRLGYCFSFSYGHGNQSSIANPHDDHENNLRTTLVIADHFKDSSSLQSLVYASAGCTVAEKTYSDAQAINEDDPISLYLDSPYQISKIVGEMYLNHLKKLLDYLHKHDSRMYMAPEKY